MFIKPKNDEPTKYLFVGNCGPATGLDNSSIGAFFKKYRPTEVLIPEKSTAASHIFLSFESVQDAQDAVLALSGKPFQELGNRLLKVNYADLKSSKVR